MAVKNEQLKTQIEALTEKVNDALKVWTDGLTRIITLSADMSDIKSEVEKQTALANQIHTAHDNSIGRLTEIVEGNGKPGLKTDIADVRGEIKLVNSRLAWLIAILVALVTPVYGGMVAYAFGLLPMPVADCCASTPPAPVIVVTATPLSVFKEPTMPPEATVSPELRYEPQDSEIDALAKLCTVEIRDMAGVRDTACLSVVSTVITRLTSGIMGGDTIRDTIARGCYPDTIHCPFPAHVVWGCDGIIARACATTYPADIAHFTHVVESYFEGARGDCDGYLSYGIKDFDLHNACVIQAANGLYQGWHDRP